MKKISVLLLAFIILTMSTGCSKVPVGYTGIKVYLLGRGKGVSNQEVLGTGRYWIGINKDLHLFPKFIQNVVWTRDTREGSPVNQEITFQDIDGLQISGDFGFSYRLQEDKIPTLFEKHRKGIEEITDVYVRMAVRKGLNEAASTRKVDDIYGKGKTDFLEDALARIKEKLDDEGFIIEQFAPVGSFRLPKQVVAALNAKIQATQQAQQRENEVQEEKAKANKRREAAKGVADSIMTVANAQAKANSKLAASISRTLYHIRKKEKAIDGGYPRFFVS
jgi:regulator of protease activity HflC (stomatin/prohibitin superfamily)